MKEDGKITRSGAKNGCNSRGGKANTKGNDIHGVSVTKYVVCAVGRTLTYESLERYPDPAARRTLHRGKPWPFTF